MRFATSFPTKRPFLIDKITMRRTLLVGAWLATISLAGPVTAAGDVIVYMKPDGDDRASGLTKETALASLTVAVKRSLAQQPEETGVRHVVVLPGRYVGQTVTVRDLPDERALVIEGVSGPAGRPVFDGNGRGRSWLVLDAFSGRPTRLTIMRLEVTNYVTAISFNGRRTSIEASNGQNEISDNVFRTIGQTAYPQGKPSTPAVRLVNSTNNRIVGNQFINIRNIVGCGALHSIYLAHYSSGNLIDGNTFDGGCGATVKTRDASNANVIRNNRFVDQSEAVFLDSYCDKDSRDDCTKETAECPSWGNQFERNTLVRLKPRARKGSVRVAGADAPEDCPMPPGQRARVIQSNNRVQQ